MSCSATSHSEYGSVTMGSNDSCLGRSWFAVQGLRLFRFPPCFIPASCAIKSNPRVHAKRLRNGDGVDGGGCVDTFLNLGLLLDQGNVRIVLPEDRLNSKLALFLDQAAEVVGQNFARENAMSLT